MRREQDKDYHENYEELIELLKNEENKTEMPENLKGKNLIHLLPDEQEIKEQSNFSKVIEWLTSRKAAPVYALAVAALFAFMVIPKISFGDDLAAGVIPESHAEVNIEENVQDEIVSAEDEPEPEDKGVALGAEANDQEHTIQSSSSEESVAAAVSNGQDGEDLSMYYDENGELISDKQKNKTEDKAEKSATKSEPQYGQNLKDDPNAFTGGFDRQRPSDNDYSGGASTASGSSKEESVPETQKEESGSLAQAPSVSQSESGKESENSKPEVSEKAESSKPESSKSEQTSGADVAVAARAVPHQPASAIDRGYYIGDWKGYNLYWRTAKSAEDFDILIEVVDINDNTVVTQPLKGVYRINTMLVTKDDNLVVIGSGTDSIVAYCHKGINGKDFTDTASNQIIGNYYGAQIKDNNLYVLTSMDTVPPSYSGDTLLLKNSAETGALGLLMWNSEKNESYSTVIKGITATDIEFTNEMLTLNYKGKKGEKYQIKYALNGTELSEK